MVNKKKSKYNNYRIIKIVKYRCAMHRLTAYSLFSIKKIDFFI